MSTSLSILIVALVWGVGILPIRYIMRGTLEDKDLANVIAYLWPVCLMAIGIGWPALVFLFMIS